MAQTDQIKRGMIIMYNNEPTLILDKEFYKPGKGGAFNRTKLKGLKTGKIVPVTFRSGEKVEEVDVINQEVAYSYADSDTVYFMNSNSFEMVNIPLEMVDGRTDFLIPEGKYICMFFEGEPISIQLPAKITLTVVETASGGDKGNTSGNPTKEAKMETGLIIHVPLFVKQGEKIVINTETKEYFGKER